MMVVAVSMAGIRLLAAVRTSEKADESAHVIVPAGQVEQVEGVPLLQTRPLATLQIIPTQAGSPQAVQTLLFLEQVFAVPSQTYPKAQGWLAQFGSWQSMSPLQSLSLPSPQLVSPRG